MGLQFSKILLLLCVFSILSFGFGLRDVSAHRLQGRVLTETENNTQSALTARTERVDPLNDLKKYEGGYNITNKHYWSSTIFTGKFGYIIAAAWLILGILYVVIVLITDLCCYKQRKKNNKYPGTKKNNVWPIVFGTLLTLLAIIASGVALGGSTRFNTRAKTVKNIIMGAANNASETIYAVTNSVEALQSNPQIYSSIDGSNRLNSTLHRLDREADNIQNKALKSMRLLNKGLKIMNVVTIVTVALNMVFILILLALAPFSKLRMSFRMFKTLCWILTCLFWAYFGLYYFLYKFSGDSCAALEEFSQDPRNSTLSSILPCNDETSARLALHDVGAGIHSLIDKVNANISSLQPLSVPGLKYVCNPFSGAPDYIYQPQNCSSDTIQIGSIPQVLKTYACTSNTTCTQAQFISASNFNIAVVYTSSIQSILNAYPGMLNLVNCKLVKDAFSSILHEECRPLKKYVYMSWAAFATLATVMVLLLVTWSVKTRVEGRCCGVDGSVNPHLTSGENSDGELDGIASVKNDTSRV